MHHILVKTRVKTACKNWLQTVCCWRLEQMSKLENQNFYFLPNRKIFLGHAQNPTSESISKCIQGPINVYNASDQRGSSLKMFPVLTRPEILRTFTFLIYSRKNNFKSPVTRCHQVVPMGRYYLLLHVKPRYLK